MDTSRSESLVEDFLQSEPKYKRKVYEFSGTFGTTPEKIFPLLCPAREADWIPGWDAELIYTNSGYAEDKCVFRTNKSNSAGEGLWTFTGFKPNEYVEFVRFQQDLLLHCKISLTQNKDGTTTTTWKTISTALTEKGNKKIERMADEKKHNPVINLMDYYLKNGKMISKSSLIKNRIHGQH
ncbi:MAG: hypothetical protein CEE43_15405 [Promethearchaeota archaeon Loki_b32]|nr:MAG: hypothetical protein CEE43_15405 [Candidatus Lokiarchaeota archaeon Loki_b32]